MRKFILGLKKEMSQIFDEKGNVVPATLVLAGPMKVISIKTKEKDGYSAIQFGFGEKNINNVKKPQKKITSLIDGSKGFRYIREFRLRDGEKIEANIGDNIDVSFFNEGEKIEVRGKTKGKGFQGVVKRHGFHGGPRSHGQKHSEREPGSIGATAPQRVFKGVRMAGRMGGETVKIRNLKIAKIDNEKNELWISGALPGRRGSLLEIIAK